MAKVIEEGLGQRPTLVIDTTPVVTHVVPHALEALAVGGRLVLAGLKGEANADLPVDLVIKKQIRLLSGYGKSVNATSAAVRMIESRRWQIDQIATHSFDLDEATSAIEAVEHGAEVVQARIEP